MQDEYDITINWRGFELHPEIPVGGMAVGDYFSPDRAKKMRVYLLEFAKRFNVEITFTDHMPSTKRALAMAEYAREKGPLLTFKTNAMAAYWKLGKDLENEQVLQELAECSSLDPVEALNASLDTEYLQRIQKIRSEANAKGVNGIPTMLFKDWIVVGCQSYDTIVTAGLKAGMMPKDTI